MPATCPTCCPCRSAGRSCWPTPCCCSASARRVSRTATSPESIGVSIMSAFRRSLLAAVVAAGLVAALTGLTYRARADTVRTAGAGLPQVVERWRHRADVAAVTVAVEVPGRPLVLAASGTGLHGGGPPVTPDAQFRIASITKPFVATVVLQLAQEGRLGLDDPLSRYLPTFPGGH